MRNTKENRRKQNKRERIAEQLKQIESNETKKTLVELAQKAWNDKKAQGRVSFAPSQKLKEAAENIFGHSISEVFITASEIRHIKDHHGANENLRGQINIKPEYFSEIYDITNGFDIAEQGKTDKNGNRSIRLIKGSDGASFSVVTEKGEQKVSVETFYKRKKKKVPPMFDAQNPEQNFQNDSVTPSSNLNPNISQT